VRRLYTRVVALLERRPQARPPIALSTSVRGAADRRLVRLCGAVSVADASPLPDPLAERPCVYYWLHVEGLPQLPGRGSPRGNDRWRTVVDDQRLCSQFWLDDGSGRALVTPSAAAPRPTHRLIAALGPASRDLPAELLRYLRRGVPGGMHGWGRLRYRFYRVEAGEQLALIGLGQREPDPNPQSAGDYRGRATRLRLVPPWFGALRVDSPES
jgi:hypothetical protein